MFNGEPEEITELARAFLEPANATHRQYEALRAFFVEKLPSAEAARRFGYSPGSFRVLCHELRKDPRRAFFLSPSQRPAECAEGRPGSRTRHRFSQAQSLHL